jgi:hypothetical protein
MGMSHPVCELGESKNRKSMNDIKHFSREVLLRYIQDYSLNSQTLPRLDAIDRAERLRESAIKASALRQQIHDLTNKPDGGNAKKLRVLREKLEQEQMRINQLSKPSFI